MGSEVEIIQYDEIKKIWLQVSRQSSTRELSLELEIHKKLLNIFQVGEQYYYIFNLANAQIEMVSDPVLKMLRLNDKTEFTTDYVLHHIHPADLPAFEAFERRAGEFFSHLPAEKVFRYKMSYDYRLMRKDGKHIRILQQVLPIQANENGTIIRTLGVHTNISHLKKDSILSLSILGMDGEPDYPNLMTYHQPVNTSKWQFTKQEKAVLKLLLDGKTSRQIAGELNISKLTADTHRRNMLHKTGLRNTAELTLQYLQNQYA